MNVGVCQDILIKILFRSAKSARSNVKPALTSLAVILAIHFTIVD